MWLCFTACHQELVEEAPTNEAVWSTGDLDRPSLLEEAEEEGEEAEVIGYIYGWFGEIFGVQPQIGFEEGALEFYLFELYADGREHFICGYFTELKFLSVQESCAPCQFAFDVEVDSFVEEGETASCEGLAPELLSFQEGPAALGYGASTFFLSFGPEAWEQRGFAEWNEVEQSMFFFDETELFVGNEE